VPAPPTMSPRGAYALLQLTVLVWGFTAIIGKQLTLNAFALTFYRQLITALVMFAWAGLRRERLAVSRADALRLVGVGGIISLHWVCFYGCIKLAGVAVGVLCIASVVLFTALIEPLVYRRGLRRAEILIGGLVLVGVWMLVRVGADASPLAGAVWLGGFVALFVPETFVAPADVSGVDWGWLVVLSVVCTALPWIWSLDVLTVLTPYTVSLSVTLEPVYSMIIAYFWFPDSERLGVSFYAGAATLLGLVVLNARLRTAGAD
jgi:drug/metabolite transporter (DMT)-like permease